MTHEHNPKDHAPLPWTLMEIEEHLAFLAKAVERPQNTAQTWLDLRDEVSNMDMRAATPQQQKRFEAYSALIGNKQTSDVR